MKSFITIIILTIGFVACSSSTENDNSKKNNTHITVTGNTHYWQTKNKIFFLHTTLPVFYTDNFDETKTYTLTLKGVYFNATYDFALSDSFTHLDEDDTTSTRLDFNFGTFDLPSDLYEAIIDDGSSASTAMHQGEKAHFVDGSGTNYMGLIQTETADWQPRDSIIVTQDLRVRPYPNMTNTSGKLYFYNNNLVEKANVGHNGSNGSRGSDGIIRTYSLRYYSSILSGMTLSTGKYLVRWENADRSKVTPFVEVNFVK